MEKRQQPLWHPPESDFKNLPELYLYNSLTSKKERFIPQNCNQVSWYSCGPTVYDSSHMGHARTYITFDILRRTMQHYFNFKVNYVMNITDIDDKIIKRARQKYLLDQFKLENCSVDKMIDYVKRASILVYERSQNDPEPEKRSYYEREFKRLEALLKTSVNLTPDALLDQAVDAVADLVDKERGSTVSDYKIFEALPRFFENEFHEDMKALNILPPNHLVRVSEFIMPIINFIQQIVKNGFAYSVDSGSVYFDTNKFAQDPKHYYAKLVPTAFGDSNQLASGEGELSITIEKKSLSDFALWKASKPGEPAWDSPWGKGRPGWHIECSAMASEALGDSMDIHSGGFDLKFPHHDNELAQSEAYHGHSHWVRYFIHSGHLTIDGCKMSKSLKNFITIREALTQNSARQLRLAFLLHSWKDTLDYSANTMAETLGLEKSLYDFTFNVSHILYLATIQLDATSNVVSTDEDNSPLYEEAIERCKSSIYSSLCDSVDTKSAINSVKELISKCNSLQLEQPLSSHHLHLRNISLQLYRASSLVLRLLRTFGSADDTLVARARVPLPSKNCTIFDASIEAKILVQLPQDLNSLPWISLDTCTLERMQTVFEGCILASKSFSDDLSASKNERIEEILNGYHEATDTISKTLTQSFKDCGSHPDMVELKIWPLVAQELSRLAELRQNVRAYAQSLPGEQKKTLLIACDRMRDQILPPLGIRLQDRAMPTDTGKADVPAIGLVNPNFYSEEERDKKRREEEKLMKQTVKSDAGKMPPEKMFLLETDQYSKWDERGIPTHDAEGKELAKSRIKKLQKIYESQAKKHEAYLNSTN